MKSAVRKMIRFVLSTFLGPVVVIMVGLFLLAAIPVDEVRLVGGCIVMGGLAMLPVAFVYQLWNRAWGNAFVTFGLGMLPILCIAGIYLCVTYLDLNAQDYMVSGSTLDDPAFDRYRDLLKPMLPEGASDIYVRHDAGCIVGGSGHFFRCKVKPESLRKYIRDRKLDFRFDSTRVNANANYPDANLSWTPPSYFSGYQGDGDLDKVDEFWSYNYIYKNNGGERMFYDVKRQLFYCDCSSN